jgi:Zn-dependent protease with chaperone function
VNFGALGICLALAWFFIGNLIVSCLVGALLRRRGVHTAQTARSAALWLWLRLSPSLTAAFLVIALFGPAYVRFEPANVVEPIGSALILLTSASIATIGWSLARAASGWYRASRLSGAWSRAAERLPVAEGHVPVYVVDAPDAAVTLTGIVRPRVFIARTVVDALTMDELDVVLAHEAGHRLRWDNLKRLVLMASPDALAGSRVGRMMASEWAWGAESTADRHAVGLNRAKGVALASALIKVARLAPMTPRAPMPVSALCERGPLAARVGRLLAIDPEAERRPAVYWPFAVVGAALTGVMLSTHEPLLRQVHQLAEWLVRLSA